MNHKNNLDTYRQRQQEIFSSLSHILLAVASPVRLNLMHFLSQAPLSVEVLAKKIDQTTANTSMHLRKMLREKIVSVEHIGQKRIYHLSLAAKTFWENCQDFLGLVIPSMQDLSNSDDTTEQWNHSLSATLKKLKNKKALLLDIRPLDEVEKLSKDLQQTLNYYHIPYDQISKNMNRLPSRPAILIMCRGRYCALSANALLALKQRKKNIYRLPFSWFAIHKKLKEIT